MNRLPVAVAAAMLALPASAAAAPTRGVVLSGQRGGRHTIQVVDGKHQAHGYRYRGSLPRPTLEDSDQLRRTSRSHDRRRARRPWGRR